jgi:hypothetical protein
MLMFMKYQQANLATTINQFRANVRALASLKWSRDSPTAYYHLDETTTATIIVVLYEIVIQKLLQDFGEVQSSSLIDSFNCQTKNARGRCIETFIATTATVYINSIKNKAIYNSFNYFFSPSDVCSDFLIFLFLFASPIEKSKIKCLKK